MIKVHTKLNIVDRHRKFICAYKTWKLTGMTTREAVEDFIVKTYKRVQDPFDIEILDQDDGFVTLDNTYIDDYKCFKPNKTTTPSAQPTNSERQTLILQIILLNYTHKSITEQECVNTTEGMFTFKNGCACKSIISLYIYLITGIQPNKDTQQNDQFVSSSKSQIHCTIPLSNDSKMAFVDGLNVNYEQRDQYISDVINVDTGKIVGKPSRIQAPKTSKRKYGSRLPRFQIGIDEVTNCNDHVFTLLVYIVLDIYQSGKRCLFYHPERAFIKEDNVKQLLDRYEIPITTTKNWTSDKGEKLELRIMAIKEAKKHPSAPLDMLCQFTDINESKLLHSSDDYRKSRLALVLQKDDVIQWETLVLSNELIFTSNKK
ncbi:unnamed protein product [Rotaria sp. Silwood2]|nr:unnamed protein product [Rotaria sp. Silwood2]CAF4288649.1 unnamed protein product [Rotaria sp. Silwood2]